MYQILNVIGAVTHLKTEAPGDAPENRAPAQPQEHKRETEA